MQISLQIFKALVFLWLNLEIKPVKAKLVYFLILSFHFVQFFNPFLVRYGTSVKLKHRSTQRYLSTSVNTVGESISKFEIRLKKKGNESSEFMIIPKYKIRTEGEQVFIDDIVCLQSISTGQFLTFSKSEALGNKVKLIYILKLMNDFNS